MARENKQIRTLRDQLAAADRRGDGKKKSQLQHDLAEKLKEIGQSNEALKEFKKGVQVAELANDDEHLYYCLRNSVEIPADRDGGEYDLVEDEEECLENLKTYEEVAKRRKNVVQMQLHLHVHAWCLQRFATKNGDDSSSYNLRAIDKAKESLEFLEEHKVAIDRDKNAVDIGGNACYKKAKLFRFLMDCCVSLNLKEEAEKYAKKAMETIEKGVPAYGSLDKPETFRWEWLTSRVDITWGNRLAVVDEMTALAIKYKSDKWKAQAAYWTFKIYFSEDKYSLEKAKEKLFDLRLHHSKHLDQLEVPIIQEWLICVYRMIKREEKLNAETDRKRKCKRAERIADQYDQFEFKRQAIKNYTIMLRCATESKELEGAHNSLAVTYLDLNDHKKAVYHYGKLLELEAERGHNTSDTVASLFFARSLSDEMPEMEMINFVEQEKKTRSRKDMLVVYDGAWKFFARRGNRRDTDFYSRLHKDVREEYPESEDEEAPAYSNAFRDEADRWEESDIVTNIERDLKNYARLEKLRSEKDKISATGESRLHEVARTGTKKEMLELIKLGFDVNRRCNAGWTPLSEAVGAGNLETAEALLGKGADVDACSKEFLFGEDEEKTGSQVTPLMEAVEKRDLPMLKMLKRRGAKITLSDSDGWTVLDYLTYAVSREEDEANKKELTKIRQEWIREFRNCGLHSFIREEKDLPRRQNQEKMITRDVLSTRRRPRGPVNEYKGTMESIGSRASRNKKHVVCDDDFDMGEGDDDEIMKSPVRSRQPSVEVDIRDDDVTRSPPAKRRSTTQWKKKSDQLSNGIVILSDNEDEEEEAENRPSTSGEKRRKKGSVEKSGEGGTMRRLSSERRMERQKCNDNSRSGTPLARMANDVSPFPDLSVGWSPPVLGESANRRNFASSFDSNTTPYRDQLNLPNSATHSYCSSIPDRSSPVITSGKLLIRVEIRDSCNIALKKRSTEPSIDALIVPYLEDLLKNDVQGEHEYMLGDETLDPSLSVDTLRRLNATLSLGDIPLVICRLTKKTMMGEYAKNADPEDRTGCLLEAITKYNNDGELVVKEAAVKNSSADAFWRALTEEGKSNGATKVHIEKWELIDPTAIACVIKGRCDELTIRACQLDDAQLSTLVEALPSRTSLSTVDISGNQLLSSETIRALLQKTPNVTNLVLSEFRLTGTVKELMEAIAVLPRLGALNLSGCSWVDDTALKALLQPTSTNVKPDPDGPAPTTPRPITRSLRLDVSDTRLSDTDFVALSASCLTSLSLSRCRLAPQSWQSLAIWLKSSKLKRLDCSNTDVPFQILQEAANHQQPIVLILKKCNNVTASKIASLHEDCKPVYKLALDESTANAMRRSVPNADRFLIKG